MSSAEAVIYEGQQMEAKEAEDKDARSEFEILLAQVLRELEELLKSKNKSYGNSAFEPCNIFSKASAEEQLKVRIDDKLNRLMKGTEYIGDDTELDLMGYLVLLRILKKKKENK